MQSKTDSSFLFFSCLAFSFFWVPRCPAKLVLLGAFALNTALKKMKEEKRKKKENMSSYFEPCLYLFTYFFSFLLFPKVRRTHGAGCRAVFEGSEINIKMPCLPPKQSIQTMIRRRFTAKRGAAFNSEAFAESCLWLRPCLNLTHLQLHAWSGFTIGLLFTMFPFLAFLHCRWIFFCWKLKKKIHLFRHHMGEPFLRCGIYEHSTLFLKRIVRASQSNT